MGKKKSLISKLRKAQEKRKTNGVILEGIGLIDYKTAVELIDLQRGSEMAVTSELVKKIAALQGDLEDTYIIIKHREKSLDDREKDIEDLHKEIHDRLAAAEKDKQRTIQGMEDATRLETSIFIQSISNVIKNLGENPNKEPLREAVRKIDEIVQQIVSIINDETSAVETRDTEEK